MKRRLFDTTLALLAKVKTITFKNKTFTHEPTIDIFYKSSAKAKQYQKVVLGVVGLGGGFLISKVL